MSRARALRRTVDRARTLSANATGEPVVIGVARGGDLVIAHAGRELGVVPAEHASDFVSRLQRLKGRVTRPIFRGERTSTLSELRDAAMAERASND